MTRRVCLLALATGPLAGRSAGLVIDVPVTPLADGLWFVPAAAGDGSAQDRGRVSNLLVAIHGRQGWLIGSGPSPAFGRAFRHTLDRRWPDRIWTVVSPWAHPESVLGVAGLGPMAHASHDEVARQMADRCAGCIERLKVRLGAAAVDLGQGDPVRLPAQRLSGEHGRLGPFDWWRMARDAQTTTTVWLHRASGLIFAPGLLWGAAAPDGRDADLRQLGAATAALDALPARPRPARWLGEQGPPQPESAAAGAAQYWDALLAAVDAGIERGDGGEEVPATLPGVAQAMTGDPRHALNWQRAWRQAESRWLQRSLR